MPVKIELHRSYSMWGEKLVKEEDFKWIYIYFIEVPLNVT